MTSPAVLHREDALFAGQAVLVLVHRYDNPDRWGRHIITPQTLTGELLPAGDWSLEFNNCCSPEFRWRPDLSPALTSGRPADAAMVGLTRVAQETAERTTARRRGGGRGDFQSLWEFIGAQVIPLEWKHQFGQNDPAILNRIEIWAVTS